MSNKSMEKEQFVQRVKRIIKLPGKKTCCELCFSIMLFVLILFPILNMLTRIDGKTIQKVFNDASFDTALRNSFLFTSISTVISISLAYLLAWSISRTNIKFKGLFSVLLVLPMLIPSISHGMGLITLFGNNGMITKFLGIDSNLYGAPGIIMGSVVYSFPVAFLMFVDILKYEDCSTYDAADILGISKFRQFISITLPYMRKAIISIVFTVFTLIITDYGVPLSIGGKSKTLPVLLYENTVGGLDYSSGIVIGIILLIPAIIAFLFDMLNKDKGKNSYTTKEYIARENKIKSVIAYTICTVATIFVLLIIASFCIQAFATAYPSNMQFSLKHFHNTIKKNGTEYLTNSLIISLLTSVVGVVATFFIAYCSARLKSKASRFLHLMSMISLAVPGLVLGLSYVIAFKSTFIYGTIIILILVNTMHFFSSPYLMMYNALNKMNSNLEDVGHILDIPRHKIMFHVIIPQTKNTLLEAFSYFFVNSMITISAVSFLANKNNKPLSLMINQFEAFNMMECAAIVAIMILGVNIIVKTIIFLLKRKCRA